MPVAEISDATAAELAKLYVDTGIDLTELPPVITPKQLAPKIGVSVGALAQDRYRRRGIPYVEMGQRRIRYLRADVARYLIAHRQGATA